jgi:phage terminase large subunit-like protein
MEGVPNEKPWLHPDVILSRNKTEHAYHLQHISGGVSALRFKTYEQGREAWQGEKLDLCHLDEEPPLAIYAEALMRLMSTQADHYGMMLVSATCLHMSPFVLAFTERTHKENHGDVKQLQNREGEVINSRVFLMAGWDDAPHLSDEEKNRFQEAIPSHEIDARSKGIPSLGSGMVYPISESLITCEPFEIPEHWARVYGLDFGWKDPTAVIFAAIDRDKDIVYFVDEYAKSELTPQVHSVELIRRGCDWMPGVYDPAGRISNQRDGSKLVDLYREAGLRHLTKANNSREEGVLRVLQRMQRGHVKIFKSLAKTLLELRMYARDDEGRIKDGNDHLMDAMRYVISSGLNIAAPKRRQEAALRDAYQNCRPSPQGWMGV